MDSLTIFSGAISGSAGAALAGGIPIAIGRQGAVTGLIVSGLNHVLHDGDGGGDPKKKKAVWDTNGDGILQKGEADYWYLYGNGEPITVDNSLIDWSGLKMPSNTKIGSEFTIQTHDAFISLPFETAATYGGTPFIRTGLKTAIIKDQEYHYRLRPNNSFRNIARNILNEIGKPGGSYYGQGYNNHYSPLLGKPFKIHFINPTIRFK